MVRSPQPLLRVTAALALCLIAASSASADFIIVPGALAGVEGAGNNGFPFNIGDFGLSSQRYQQVYAASAFSSTGGPVLITQISFRPDATFGHAFSTTLANVQIDLSTTGASPTTLSATFANNVGPNDTVVFSGALPLSSAFTGPAGGPKDFDIVINLQTPFLYDPAQGNLLLDVRNFAGGVTSQFDADAGFGTVSSRDFSTGGVGAASGFLDSTALVTRFTTAAAVPEPASVALLGTGLVGLLGYGLRRRRTAI